MVNHTFIRVCKKIKWLLYIKDGITVMWRQVLIGKK